MFWIVIDQFHGIVSGMCLVMAWLAGASYGVVAVKLAGEALTAGPAWGAKATPNPPASSTERHFKNAKHHGSDHMNRNFIYLTYGESSPGYSSNPIAHRSSHNLTHNPPLQTDVRTRDNHSRLEPSIYQILPTFFFSVFPIRAMTCSFNLWT